MPRACRGGPFPSFDLSRPSRLARAAMQIARARPVPAAAFSTLGERTGTPGPRSVPTRRAIRCSRAQQGGAGLRALARARSYLLRRDPSACASATTSPDRFRGAPQPPRRWKTVRAPAARTLARRPRATPGTRRCAERRAAGPPNDPGAGPPPAPLLVSAARRVTRRPSSRREVSNVGAGPTHVGALIPTKDPEASSATPWKTVGPRKCVERPRAAIRAHGTGVARTAGRRSASSSRSMRRRSLGGCIPDRAGP